MALDNKDTLKAAVVGLGVGEKHILGFESDPRCSVTMICDINRKILNEVGERYPKKERALDPDDVFNNDDVDVVSIASYDDAHCDQIIKAINANKHVFVEKPLCLSSGELARIRSALSTRPGLLLTSNLILRESHRLKTLKKRIVNGELGNIYYFEGDYDYGRLPKLTSGWRGNIDQYSVFLGGGIHLVDLFLWLVGGQHKEIHGFSSNLCAKGSKFAGADFTVGIVKFSDEVIAKFTSNYGSVTPHHHRLAVYGTKGSFIQSHLGAVYYFDRDKKGAEIVLNDPYPGTMKGDLIPNFVSAILDQSKLIVSTDEVLQCMELALKIDEAAAR